MPARYRTLIEEELFSRQVKKLGGAFRIDDALDPIIEALATRPEGFSTIPGWEPFRLAKTVPLVSGGGDEIPGLRVWFRVENDEVHLMYVEEIPET